MPRSSPNPADLLHAIAYQLSKHGAALFAVCLLSSCAWFSQAPPPAPPAPVVPKRDVIAEIRQAASLAGSNLDIQLIQSPAIQALLKRAELLQSQGAHDSAERLLLQAQEIEARNPLVLQFRAEAQLRRESVRMAEALAQQSFENSAQLGTLCMRNWLTIREARLALDDLVGAEAAQSRAKSCDVPPVERL